MSATGTFATRSRLGKPRVLPCGSRLSAFSPILRASPMSSPPTITKQPDQPGYSDDLIFYCRICFRGLATETPRDPDQPAFYVTSCGHLVCSEHVFPNGAPPDAMTRTHTCPYCETSGASFAGLLGGRAKPPAGLKDYFTPPKELLETFGGAFKFQVDHLIHSAAHYKSIADKLASKLENQKDVLLRVKDELLEARELKKENPALKAQIARLQKENDNLRTQLDPSQRQQGDAQRPLQSPSLQASNNTSPTGVNDNTLKRKVDDTEEQNTRIRDFRRVLNANVRIGMPPPVLPIPTSSHSPRNPQNQMLQHGLPAQAFMNKDHYAAPNHQGFRQNNGFEEEQRFQCSNDEYTQQMANHRSFQNQNQNYQRPPQTPQQSFFSRTDIPHTPINSNPPFRNPFPVSRSYTGEHRISYLSPPTSRPGFEHHYRGNANPNITPSKGRLSLAPPSSSHHYPISSMSRSQTMDMGSSGVSPFFSRPGSVAGDGRNTFEGPFMQRPQSSRPSMEHGTGGLGALLNGSGNYMDRPGLRRSVRRE
ncbi:hypothetical protein FN846DRAFT_173080 [Sphaerosporella brunnea]|uniref:RING-type domain-containing protein n=1 Tax=Sphaerosporella brunnea TaxID=1250544 RepID=A0A5J5EPB3_9PEZI|nr:hypothetical protein FN846DRAFT_173080 [Sphaerosporella brunnea]